MQQGGKHNNLGEEREKDGEKGDPRDEDRDRDRERISKKDGVGSILKQPNMVSVASKQERRKYVSMGQIWT